MEETTIKLNEEGLFVLKRKRDAVIRIKNGNDKKVPLRVIDFFDEIDIDTMLELVKKIRDFNEHEDAKKFPGPIMLNVNSGGGDPHAAMFAVTEIRKSKLPVICYAGPCNYSAALLLIAGMRDRRATEFSKFMWHNITGSIYGFGKRSVTAADIELHHERFVNDAKLIDGFLSKFTNLSTDEWNKLIGGGHQHSEVHFTAEEAIKYGLIDIIEEI